QSCSYPGPLVFVHGISAVHGMAHVVGSSTVNWLIMVLSAVRVKRSMRCSFSLDPRKLMPFMIFVVSTTDVSPSQCPTEYPYHSRMFCGTCGRPSVGMMRVAWFVS